MKLRLKDALGMALLLAAPCAVALFYSGPAVYTVAAPDGKAVFLEGARSQDQTHPAPGRETHAQPADRRHP